MSLTKLLLIASEFPPQPGGIGTHAYQIAKELSKHDIEVSVLTDQRSANGEEEHSFDQKLTFEVHRVKRKYVLILSYFDRIFRAIRCAKRQDVVLLSGKFSLWIGGFLSLIGNKKLLAVIHGSEVLLSNRLLRSYTSWCLRRFDHVIAVSNFTLSLVEDMGLKSATVIPNGFEVSGQQNFNKEQPPELSLITVGNITQRKGQHNVVEALPLLKSDYPNFKYHVVGIPTKKESLKLLAKELGVEEHLIFHGRVSDEKKVELLKEASVFIMLSETTIGGDVEGFGIAILEANALGLPAIGAMGCGIEDAILEGKSGKLIASNQPEACKKAIDEILSNYQYFSREAKAWTEKFRWPEVIKQYLILIKDL